MSELISDAINTPAIAIVIVPLGVMWALFLVGGLLALPYQIWREEYDKANLGRIGDLLFRPTDFPLAGETAGRLKRPTRWQRFVARLMRRTAPMERYYQVTAVCSSSDLVGVDRSGRVVSEG